MKKTLLAASIALAFGASGAVRADGGSSGDVNESINVEDIAAVLATSRSAALNDSKYNILDWSRNLEVTKSVAVAKQKLEGSVSYIGVSAMGNKAFGAFGGDGGSARGGEGGRSIGGDGGYGGSGGNASNHAGTYNASNTMSGSFQHSSGINLAVQNTGHASLIQQAVNAQVNLRF
jgi:hypothetical protein